MSQFLHSLLKQENSENHLSNRSLQVSSWIAITTLFLTTACAGPSASLQETENAVSPSPSAKSEQTDLPPPTLQTENEVVPSPTRASGGTASTSNTDISSDEGIQAMVREQLGQPSGGYFLLQFSNTPLDQTTRSKLEESGVILSDYVPESAYYAYLPPESLSILEELLQAGVIRHVGPIPNSAKLEPGLQEKVKADPQQRIEVIVQFFEEPSAIEQRMLEEWMEATAYAFGPVNFAEGTIVAADLEKILSLTFVKWIEEQSVNELGGGN